MSAHLSIEIFVKEGLVSVPVPAPLAERIRSLYADEGHASVLELTALFLLRMGTESGTAQVGSWLDRDPRYLGDVPQALRRRLAFQPESFLEEAPHGRA